MKPSILIITPSRVSPAFTGGHQRTLNVGKALAKQGYGVTVLSLAGRSEDYSLADAQYLTVPIEENLVEVVDLRLRQGLFQSLFRRIGYSKYWAKAVLPILGLSPISRCLIAQKDVLIFDSPLCQ